jgi:CRP-like cAMP-binding protein
MSSIVENVNKLIQLTKEEEVLFLSKIEFKSYKTKTILLSPAEIANATYFVNSGILRSFNVNENIIEHVLHFACEGWWIGDMYSYISQKPVNLFIEVLEDAELAIITKNNQEELYLQIPKLERFFRILAENSLVSHQERLMDNLSLTAEERFEKFCTKYPTLIQKISQKNIASYIGVTPEFFSKMKSKILRK